MREGERKPAQYPALWRLQIRIFCRILELWGKTPFGCRAIAAMRHRAWLNTPLRFLVGYRKTFRSFRQAEKYAAHFQFTGHEHPDNIAHHSGQAERLRESDYPVLFHLAPFATELRKIFDLGGNIGNLFYSLQTELRFREDLVWEVYDLPLMRAEGQRVSERKRESRIHFTSCLGSASGSDLLIASGSLHYFEPRLAHMLHTLDVLPDRIIINRTPCTVEDPEIADLITVQDNGSYMVPAKIHNPVQLIQSLCALGYALRSSWPVYERSLWVPLYPEISSRHYRGFYFVKTVLQKGAERPAGLDETARVTA